MLKGAAHTSEQHPMVSVCLPAYLSQAEPSAVLVCLFWALEVSVLLLTLVGPPAM